MPRLRKGIRADPDAEGSRERGDLSVVQESANGAVDQQCDGQDQSEELTATRPVGSQRANTGSSTRLTRRPRSSHPRASSTETGTTESCSPRPQWGAVLFLVSWPAKTSELPISSHPALFPSTPIAAEQHAYSDTHRFNGSGARVVSKAFGALRVRISTQPRPIEWPYCTQYNALPDYSSPGGPP